MRCGPAVVQKAKNEGSGEGEGEEVKTQTLQDIILKPRSGVTLLNSYLHVHKLDNSKKSFLWMLQLIFEAIESFGKASSFSHKTWHLKREPRSCRTDDCPNWREK